MQEMNFLKQALSIVQSYFTKESPRVIKVQPQIKRLEKE